MKRGILVSLFASILLAGCGVYGTGETVGYVYAVDDGIFWDKVWYKSTLEASESDCYLVDDDFLKSQLRELSGKTKIKLSYERHVMTMANCVNSDVITSFQLL